MAGFLIGHRPSLGLGLRFGDRSFGGNGTKYVSVIAFKEVLYILISENKGTLRINFHVFIFSKSVARCFLRISPLFFQNFVKYETNSNRRDFLKHAIFLTANLPILWVKLFPVVGILITHGTYPPIPL